MVKILFIEDDKVLRENTAELLEIANYEVITAHNGQVGIRLAKSENPDVVVCDIMMPEMDGYAVLKALSENEDTQNTPFIFLSAKTEHSDIRKGMNLGADDYLTKPFEEEELIGAIESRLAKMAILNKRKDSLAALPKKQAHHFVNLRDYIREFEQTSYKKGEEVYRQGQQNNRFFMVENGVIKTHRMDERGKELITSICKEDDFFGSISFSKNTSYEETATAMEMTKVYSIFKDELKQILIKNKDLAFELIDFMDDNIEETKEQLLEMAYGSVRKKTANTILMFSQNIRKFPMKSIRISRSDLASVAGMAPESLIRTLADFKKESYIEIEGRNIVLLDVEGLKRIV